MKGLKLIWNYSELVAESEQEEPVEAWPRGTRQNKQGRCRAQKVSAIWSEV